MPASSALATIAAVLLVTLALVRGDPDLPGHTSPTETLDMLTLVIPMDRTYQGAGMTNNYAANGTAQPGAFNMRAYAPSAPRPWPGPLASPKGSTIKNTFCEGKKGCPECGSGVRNGKSGKDSLVSNPDLRPLLPRLCPSKKAFLS